MSVSQSGMRSNFTLSDPLDRARSVVATAAIHLALGAALLAGLALKVDQHADDGLKTFDVVPPPPPAPLPMPEQPSKAPRGQAGHAGKKAEPSPITAPPARLPTTQPVVAAPIAGTGSSSSAGAASTGNGTGAGGTGAGRGGGGGIGTGARLLSGNRARLPRQLLRVFAADRGYAHLQLTISDSGRASACTVFQGTGSVAVDQALCRVMVEQSRWSPALDTAGRPISVQLTYTSTWSK